MIYVTAKACAAFTCNTLGATFVADRVITLRNVPVGRHGLYITEELMIEVKEKLLEFARSRDGYVASVIVTSLIWLERDLNQ